jgi:hypothetical protein
MLSSSSNGIFANDAALVSRHVVGLETLNANQQAAARVSGNAVLSSFDAALIARWLVGFNDLKNQTGQWEFQPANRMYANVNTSQTGQNYSALLMGDVSGDWSPTPLSRAAEMVPTLPFGSILVSAPSLDSTEGEEVTIPVRIDNLEYTGVSSYQFDIEYDPNVISPAGLAVSLESTLGSGLNVVSNSPTPGLLKVAVYGSLPVMGDGVYANLRFVVTAAGGASTLVNITGCRINDGEKAITTAAGRVTVK